MFIAAVLVGCSDPQTADECVDLAQEHFNNGRYASALDLCNKAIELEPGDWGAYNMRAIVHLGLGNTQQSIADYTKAIELAPDDPTKSFLLTGRSFVYESKGDFLNMGKDRVEAKKLEFKGDLGP